jgi:hypothetical protein
MVWNEVPPHSPGLLPGHQADQRVVRPVQQTTQSLELALAGGDCGHAHRDGVHIMRKLLVELAVDTAALTALILWFLNGMPGL